jgi:hypothetical protein
VKAGCNATVARADLEQSEYVGKFMAIEEFAIQDPEKDHLPSPAAKDAMGALLVRLAISLFGLRLPYGISVNAIYEIPRGSRCTTLPSNTFDDQSAHWSFGWPIGTHVPIVYMFGIVLFAAFLSNGGWTPINPIAPPSR